MIYFSINISYKTLISGSGLCLIVVKLLEQKSFKWSVKILDKVFEIALRPSNSGKNVLLRVLVSKHSRTQFINNNNYNYNNNNNGKNYLIIILYDFCFRSLGSRQPLVSGTLSCLRETLSSDTGALMVDQMFFGWRVSLTPRASWRLWDR